MCESQVRLHLLYGLKMTEVDKWRSVRIDVDEMLAKDAVRFKGEEELLNAIAEERSKKSSAEGLRWAMTAPRGKELNLTRKSHPAALPLGIPQPLSRRPISASQQKCQENVPQRQLSTSHQISNQQKRTASETPTLFPASSAPALPKTTFYLSLTRQML